MEIEVGRGGWSGGLVGGGGACGLGGNAGGSGFQATVFRLFGLDRAGVDNKIPRRD